MTFAEWLIERAMHQEISDEVIGKLRDVLNNAHEVGGLIRGVDVQVISQGGDGGVQMGSAQTIRQTACNYTFHTHPSDRDVPYPSPMDVVGVYMTGKTDLVVCQTGIWAVTPLRRIDWQEVEKINNRLKQEAGEDYGVWKSKVKQHFPVRIEKVAEFKDDEI